MSVHASRDPTATARPSAPPWRRDLAVTLLALVAVLAWDLSGLDLALTRLWGAPTGFAWRDHVLTATVLHEGRRWLAGLALAGLALDAWRPLWPGPTRAQRVATLAFIVGTMVLVPLHKRISLTSCPWSLREFGGVADYVPHWLPGLADGGPGVPLRAAVQLLDAGRAGAIMTGDCWPGTRLTALEVPALVRCRSDDRRRRPARRIAPPRPTVPARPGRAALSAARR